MSFASAPERATVTSEAAWLTGPLTAPLAKPVTQNIASINKAPNKPDCQPLFVPFDVQTVAGSSQTCFTDSEIPDYWIVSVRPIAAVRISIFLNANNSGIPIRLAGGGWARLPGISEYLTVVGEATSAACPVTVLAVRGYCEVEVDGGNVS